MTSASENSLGKDQPPAITSSDAAWVRISVPLAHDVLLEICKDAETLFRLNPYYYFKIFERGDQKIWRAEFENQSNQTQNTVSITFNVDPGCGATAWYSTGLKKRTVFTAELATEGATLTITDDYEGISAEEREQRLAEVDKSLSAWGESLRVYFVRLRRYSWIPGWRWYIQRFWMPMKPSARRIVWLLCLITLVEFAFFLFVLLIWMVEQNK